MLGDSWVAATGRGLRSASAAGLAASSVTHWTEGRRENRGLCELGPCWGFPIPEWTLTVGRAALTDPAHYGVGTLHEGMLPAVPLLPALWPRVVVLERTWPPLLSWEAEA